MPFMEGDPEGKRELAGFARQLRQLGWVDGDNVRVEYRWAGGDSGRMQSQARELVALPADVIVANSSPLLRAVQQQTSTVPIVFAVVSEPVAQGFVQSLARPGGNITGFTNLEPSFGPKWLEVLKEIAPRVGRVSLIFNPRTAPYAALFADTAQAAAHEFTTELLVERIDHLARIEAVMANLSGDPKAGLIFPPDPFTSVNRAAIIAQAARYRLPAVYAFRHFTAEGGLVSYGVDIPDLLRQAAVYVDRILRGEKPANLAVQQPTKFELLINLKAARTLGLKVPPMLLARADELIE
jgi:putative tryptophan/tyrosine transport system substrate-binding protein